MAINYIVVRKRSRKAVKRILSGIVITPPGGPYLVDVEYTFSATTTAASPTWLWSGSSGVTIVSGGSTDTVVVKFTTAGSKSLTASVVGAGSRTWTGVATEASTYSPSLDFSDDRNSMYAGCLN